MARTAIGKMTERAWPSSPEGAVYHSPGQRPGWRERLHGHPAPKGRATHCALLSPVDWPAPPGLELDRGVLVLNCRGQVALGPGGRTPFGPTMPMAWTEVGSGA